MCTKTGAVTGVHYSSFQANFSKIEADLLFCILNFKIFVIKFGSYELPMSCCRLKQAVSAAVAAPMRAVNAAPRARAVDPLVLCGTLLESTQLGFAYCNLPLTE